MDRKITASVGIGGANKSADVKIIQEMLNKAHLNWGGPNPKLVVDGICGPKTKGAIMVFQQAQLGTIFFPDGRVDANGRTLARLNHIWGSSETPGGERRVSVEPLDHVRQPTNMTCWAAAGTMLRAAKDQKCYEIETVMRFADAGDPGYGYLAKFQTNQGLPPADTGRYTRSLGLSVGPPMCFPVDSWVAMMRNRGAIGVVGLTPFLHIRVISEIYGDGTVFGTYFKVHDPGRQQPYEEVFQTFTERYEAAANINDRMDQVWFR